MTSFGLLEQADEDTLHSSRLLNIEEKVFRRLSKRILSRTSIFSKGIADSDDSASPNAVVKKQWTNDALLDFAAFEANIVRVQFLLDSNDRERDRYTNERSHIIGTAQAVRVSNTRLSNQLFASQQKRDLRKDYDKLAEEITSNKTLKPRDEQHANLVKLSTEIAELEREKEDYRRTWAERRDQFEKIVEEGRAMLRLIRDEKEEAERMDDDMENSENDDNIDMAQSNGGGSANLSTDNHHNSVNIKPSMDAEPSIDAAPLTAEFAEFDETRDPTAPSNEGVTVLDIT